MVRCLVYILQMLVLPIMYVELHNFYRGYKIKILIYSGLYNIKTVVLEASLQCFTERLVKLNSQMLMVQRIDRHIFYLQWRLGGPHLKYTKVYFTDIAHLDS